MGSDENRLVSHTQSILASALYYAIITMDENGIITNWSPGAEIMFGYKATEAIGMHTRIIFTPEDTAGEIAATEMNRARATGVSIDERWHIRKDNTRFFMSGVMTPLKETDQPGFLKIARNITSSKLMEEALQLLESKKNNLPEADHAGQWDITLQENTIVLNEKAVTILDLKTGYAEFDLADILSNVHVEDKALLQEQYEKVLNGLPAFSAQFRYKYAGNYFKWLYLYGRIVAFDNQQPVRLMGVLYDVNNRKILEEQKDNFISYASHELKIPVTAIQAYSEILMNRFELTTDKANYELLNKLMNSIDRLTQLTKTLLDTNAISEGSMQLYPRLFNLNDAILQQLNEMAPLTSSHSITWEPGPIPTIHADYNRILQVITNLLTNAIKYSPPKSTITIKTQDQFGKVLVTVSNTGAGIPVEAQPFIFERYYRVAGEPGTGNEGFGLGLYICAEIIRNHSGQIGFESVPGKETSFYFTLPY